MSFARVCLAACMTLLAFSLASATTDSPSISSVLQPYIQRHELAGAVTAVVSKDGILNLGAVGYSDISAKKPMRTDSLFWIASMSKPIVAAALMMLVDEGKVRLDDPVNHYLPQFMPRIIAVTADQATVRLKKPQRAITVRHLLSHTSGLPFTSSLETVTLDEFPLAIRVQSYTQERLLFEPGSNYSYSNEGINTAARIIEVVSGMHYEKFLQQRLFDPLEMKDTTFWPTEAQLARLAKSYKSNAAGTGLQEVPIRKLRYPLTDRAHRYVVPAGGLFSTVTDLGEFCQMLLNGGTFAGKRYLSEVAIREMARNQLDRAHQPAAAQLKEHGGGYGLGWVISASGAFSHDGAYATNMTIDPEHGLATIWLVQHEGFPGSGNQSRAAFEKAATQNFNSLVTPR